MGAEAFSQASRKFNSNMKVLNVFWTWPVSKLGRLKAAAEQFNSFKLVQKPAKCHRKSVKMVFFQKKVRKSPKKYVKVILLIKNNVLRKLIISRRQYPESCRHNQTFDLQPMTYCFGIDICLLFLVSIARTTGMNIRVERQRIAN